MATQKLSVSLDGFSYDLLVALAREKDRSLSYMICVAIQRYAEGNEWPGSGLNDAAFKALLKKHGIEDESPKR